MSTIIDRIKASKLARPILQDGEDEEEVVQLQTRKAILFRTDHWQERKAPKGFFVGMCDYDVEAKDIVMSKAWGTNKWGKPDKVWDYWSAKKTGALFRDAPNMPGAWKVNSSDSYEKFIENTKKEFAALKTSTYTFEDRGYVPLNTFYGGARLATLIGDNMDCLEDDHYYYFGGEENSTEKLEALLAEHEDDLTAAAAPPTFTPPKKRKRDE